MLRIERCFGQEVNFLGGVSAALIDSMRIGIEAHANMYRFQHERNDVRSVSPKFSMSALT